jgi:hypothetical protein
MNENIEQLMYEAGLTADGCFNDMDSYDKEAVLKVIELTIKKCADLCQDVTSSGEYSPNQQYASAACRDKIKNHFGLNDKVFVNLFKK